MVGVRFLRQRHKLIVIGCSAGGLEPLIQLLSGLPQDLPAAIVILQHLAPVRFYKSILPELLAAHTRLPVKWIQHRERVCTGVVYVSPQDMQSTLTSSLRFDLAPVAIGWQFRPAADPLFCSAAESLGERVIGIVLSGGLSDGTRGAHRIVENGGRVFAQDGNSASACAMPRAAIKEAVVDFVLSPVAMAHALKAILMAPGADAWFRVSETERLLLCSQS